MVLSRFADERPGARVLRPRFLFAWFGILAAGLAGLIPLGSGADRWRLGAICASTALLAGVDVSRCSPIGAGAAAGSPSLGVNYGLGRGYLDAGGAGTIHAWVD